MRRILVCLSVWLLLTSLEGDRRSGLAQELPAEPWRAAYEGSDAQGPHVLGYWRFESDDAAREGGRLEICIQVHDESHQPVPAVVPLELVITDPNGRVAERSGYYGAAQGELTVPIDIAANDTPGIWQIHACELVTGQSTDHYVRVAPAER